MSLIDELRTFPEQIDPAPAGAEMLFREARRRARRRRAKRVATGLGAFVVLMAGAVGALRASGAKAVGGGHVDTAAASGAARLLTCTGDEAVRPVAFTISCADGNARLTKTAWTAWTSLGATGTTDFGLNLCDPYCAASRLSYFPGSTVRLKDPVETRHGRLFELLVVRYRDAGRQKTFSMSWEGVPAFS